MRAARAALLMTLLQGCSYTFDGDQPEVRLQGSAPSLAGLQHLSRKSSDAMQFVTGVDGRAWVALYQVDDLGDLSDLRLVRLGEPATLDGYAAARVSIGRHALYLADPMPLSGSGSTHVTVVRPGGAPVGFDFPDWPPAQMVGSSDDSVFLYADSSSSHATFFLQRLDGSFRRSFPAPSFGAAGEAGAVLGFGFLFFFDHDGELFFTFEQTGHVVAHSTRSENDTVLGLWGEGALPELGPLVLDSERRQLVFCDRRGLLRMPFDGSPERMLDELPCAPLQFSSGGGGLVVTDGRLVYSSGGEIRSVPLDGSAPPLSLPEAPGSRLLAVHPDHVATTTSDPGRYKSDASDGFIDGRRFMERGREPTFSRDGTRIRWLEHAADEDGTGDLSAAPSVGGAPRVLARNVSHFVELGDGRVLSAANHAFVGQQNRIIVVDEARRTARWVAGGATGYTVIPGSDEILAELVTDGDALELVRCPIPPAGDRR